MCGGILPASTQFDQYETADENGNLVIERPVISKIVREGVNHFGNEQLGKILISDLDDRVKTVMKWTGNTPLYLVSNNGNNRMTTTYEEIEDLETTEKQASGESLSLQNTLNKKINPEDLILDGKCEQETTTGKNLFKPLNIKNNGITTTYDKNGVGTIKGTPTSSWANISSSFKYPYPAGNYVLSIDKPKTFNVQIKGTYTDKEIFEFSISAGSKTKNMAFKKEVYGIYAYISGLKAGVNFNETIKIQLEKGSTATDYELYTGGQPSPSPDYLQEIKTITGNIKVTSCGKNLYFNDKDVHSFTPSTGGWKFLNGNGGADSSESNKTIYKAKVEKDKTYTFIANIKSSASISSALMYDDNQKVVAKSGENITYNHTFIAKKSAYVLLRNYVNSGVSVEISNVMLVEGQATEYEPYQDSSLDITIPSNEFAGKLDDTYKDELKIVYKEDGKLHKVLYKKVGKVVFDGSETFYINAYAQTLGYNIFVYKGLVTSLASGDNPCKSNYFIHYSWGQFNIKDAIYQNSNWIMFKCDSLNIGNDIDKFKNWLSTHNTEVYYPLATPYEVDLGTIDEMPSTYEGTTYIWNNKKANINLSYRVYEGDYGHITYNYGDDVGFIYTDFTYPGELVGNAGDNISGIIDKIKGTLGNFEDFYDIYGNFRLQEIKNYLNTSHATTLLQSLTKDDYVIDQSQGKSVYDFSNSKLITSFSNTPQYLNIKNDYVV